MGPLDHSSAEELALLVDAVEDYAIFLLSPEGEIRSWNRGACRVMGYEESEALGRHFSMFYGPEDLAADKPRHELETAAATGRIEDEGWRVRKGGKRFWANTVITPLRNADGSVHAFAKVTRDLTARREAEDRVRQNAEIFQLLVSSVREYAIFMLDPDGNIATWNSGAQRIKGYKPEEIIGRHFSTFYGEEDRRNHKPERELEIAREKGWVEDEGWRIRKDGSRFWANVVITAVYGKDGVLRGFAKVTRDMSEKREAQEQLRQTTETFQLLVSSVRDYAIFMLDPTGHVATWNSGAQSIKGYKPEEIIGKHFSTFYTEEDIRKGEDVRELQEATERGAVEREGWRVRKDGSRFWANVVLTAVRDSHGELRGFAKVTRDITDRKIAEETQRALYEQREARRKAEAGYQIAREANRAKDEFLMMLSHELRTPMTSILGWARLLPTISPSDPIFNEAVASIAQGARLQARLIDDILDVSRIVAGKLRLTPEKIDVAKVILSATDAVRTTAEAKTISLKTVLAPDLGTMVADGTRVQQVVWNLLSNAVKFTQIGGEVKLTATRANDRVQIVVEDNGEGIDPEFLQHVFEPFRQAEIPNTRVHGGLGLGLSIVRYIVEAHGGTITGESAGRGKGAKFTASLPVRAHIAAETPRTDRMHAPERERLQGLDILVIDDDAESRKMIATGLRSAGATVVEADSARVAMEQIASAKPDIVVTDIAMPQVDGRELTRRLRETPEGAGMKIIALSAFARTADDTDFDEYITKPIDPFEMVNIIARVAMQETA